MNHNADQFLKHAQLFPQTPPAVAARSRGAATPFDRAALRAITTALADPPFTIVLWDGSRSREPPAGIVVHILDRAALWGLFRNPSVSFGDLYVLGRIHVEGDLVTLLEQVYHGLEQARQGGRSWLRGWWRDQAPRSTDPDAARGNIHHHYDLGNDFYQMWLDRDAMQYTCAYFPAGGETLEAAQRAKMDHVCRKLRLAPGQRVVEAGCGWGGFALHMARDYGVHVRAYNISHEQVRHARESAARAGLTDRVEFVEDDYRNIRGRYAAFVSIGMLEHVGPAHYQQLGIVIERCLEPHGIGVLHTIGRNRPGRLNGWIERRIFPGAYPPSLAEMAAIFEPTAFSILDVENLRLHYAETLGHWLARFNAHEAAVRARYDPGFVRAWRLYLAGSAAAFKAGTMQLFQVQFARSRDNDVPRTRGYMYPCQAAPTRTPVDAA